jgi:integrase
MNLTSSTTTAEWREIWLAKLKESCIDKGLKKPTEVGFLGFVSRYLAPHSCHPATIPLDAVSSFLKQNSKSEHLLEQGTDLRYIQELLGHSSTSTNSRSHAMPA